MRNEPLTRTAFDEVVAEAFAKTPRSRKEQGWGWTDTLDLNLLRLRVTAYTERRGFMRSGDLMVELVGVRTSIDGSSTPLWSRKTTGLDGLRDTLIDLRKRLLGLAAALLTVCGEPVEVPSPARPDSDDISGLFQ